MKRLVSLFVVLLCLLSLLSAESYLSVSLSSDAYRIIDTAEIRGIIPSQSDVKPYTVSHVRNLLAAISSSDKTTESEKVAIENILSDLERSYGTSSTGSVLQDGYISLSKGSTSVAVGARVKSAQTYGLYDNALDSRNTVNVFVRGDFFSAFSINMDLGMLFNKIDHRAFLVTDFRDNCDGFYLNMLDSDKFGWTSPFGVYAFGTGMNPEIATSLFSGALTLRFASVEHDWGPGLNNLGLSASARSFDAFDFTLSPASWISFSVAIGSLGKSFVTMTGEAPYIGDTTLQSSVYDNNFSIQRVEIEPFEGFRASIYESVVWRKRFELAYLNPFSVYMFAQNYIGDMDNILIGLDASYTWKGVGKFYAALAVDEMNGAKLFWPRNLISYQAGAVFSVPYSDFSSLTVQATYVSPFFGSHYVIKAEKNPWGSTAMGTAYINKGSTLSYPLYPDSLEFLLSYSTTITEWNTSLTFTVKDQMRSAQYSTDEYGTTLGTLFNYHYFDSVGEYAKRDLFSYIWCNTLDFSLTAKKHFASLPFDINTGIECIVESKRSYTFNENVKEYDWYDFVDVTDKMTNPGNGTVMGDDWTTKTKLNLSIGFSIYY